MCFWECLENWIDLTERKVSCGNINNQHFNRTIRQFLPPMRLAGWLWRFCTLPRCFVRLGKFILGECALTKCCNGLLAWPESTLAKATLILILKVNKIQVNVNQMLLSAGLILFWIFIICYSKMLKSGLTCTSFMADKLQRFPLSK